MLGWTTDEQGAFPAGNIDQMALDILRQLLTADIERYLVSTGQAHHRDEFSVCQHKRHARNYLQKSSWFTPTRSVPDRQWSMDLANNTMNKMLLIKEHLKGVNATIDTAMSNMEKVTWTLETGGAQQYLFKDDRLKELDEIIRKLDQKGSQGRLQRDFTLNREYIGRQNPILQKWTPPTLP